MEKSAIITEKSRGKDTTRALAAAFDWWGGNVISKQHGIVYFIAKDGGNVEKTKQRYHVLPVQLGLELLAKRWFSVVQHSSALFTTTPPPPPPWYRKEKRKREVEFWQNLGVSLPSKQSNSPLLFTKCGLCLSLRHAEAAVVGGTREKGFLSVCVCVSVEEGKAAYGCIFPCLFHYAYGISGCLLIFFGCVFARACVSACEFEVGGGGYVTGHIWQRQAKW